MTNKQTIDGVSRAALEALKSAKLFISNGIDLGFIRMPDAETPDPAHDTLPMIDKAIEELRDLLDAPADTRTETVPKHKFDTLVQYCKRLEVDIAQARAHVNEITLYQQNAVWFWQHDGEDFLESLSCPIIIQPHHLRELLKGAVQAGQPEPVAVVMPARLDTEDGYSVNAANWYNKALDDVELINSLARSKDDLDAGRTVSSDQMKKNLEEKFKGRKS